MLPTLETPRLLLRPLSTEDAPQIQETFPRWEIVRYLSHLIPWPYPPDGAIVYIRDIALPAMARGEEWIWTLRLKEAPERIIGSISLMRKEGKNRGFWIDPAHSSRGLMTEAADAVTDYWFDVLRFPMLRVPKAIANVPSRRISEKQGMRLVGFQDRDYVSGRTPSEVWEITAEEWRDRRRRQSDRT